MMVAVGAAGGCGLLLTGVAIGFWMGRAMRPTPPVREDSQTDAIATERLAALQRHAQELHLLVAEHRQAMQGWETSAADADRQGRRSSDREPSGDEALRKRHSELSRKIAHAEA